ncbi:MAG: radical SAM protein [Deltaproteobacteria bacterium]|nr:radical SAM protein [Deltaproteobacteria bacterium]
MAESLCFKGLTVMRVTTPCANHCRFCSAGTKIVHNIPFDRYEAVVERFLNWRDHQNLVDFPIAPVQLYSLAQMPPDHLRRRFELCRRGGYEPLPLQINGLGFRPDDELRCLLIEKKEAGFKQISLTFAGPSEMHDLWCGRKGEFDFLVRIAVICGEIGFPRLEKLFLTESSWTRLPELMDFLDRISGEVIREIHTLSYVGWAKFLEKERIHESTNEALPERVRKLAKLDGLKTEREWFSIIDQGHIDQEVLNVSIMIRLQENNLEWIEETDCEEVVEELKFRRQEAWSVLPPLYRLASAYGDRNNDCLYRLSELRHLWLDRFARDSPTLADQVDCFYNSVGTVRK